MPFKRNPRLILLAGDKDNATSTRCSCGYTHISILISSHSEAKTQEHSKQCNLTSGHGRRPSLCCRKLHNHRNTSAETEAQEPLLKVLGSLILRLGLPLNTGKSGGTILPHSLCCYKSYFLCKAVAKQVQIPDQREEIETTEATVTI